MSEPRTGNRLARKVVAVTGAGRGIGRCYALAMAREGACVVVNDLGTDLEGSGRAAAPSDEVVQEIRAAGGQAIVSTADVSLEVGARSIVEAATGEYGRLDALVNNAAIEFRGTLEEHSADVFARIMAVNLTGSFNCAKAAIPVMLEQGTGAIINTTSGAFWEGTEGVAAYSASKAGVFSLTLTQHSELAKRGISSTCIAPNATRTRMLDSWIAQLSESAQQPEEEIMAEWGIQTAENLAPLAVFLCSDAGRSLSGNVFEVWGDRIARIAPPCRGASLARDGAEWDVEVLAEGLPRLLQ